MSDRLVVITAPEVFTNEASLLNQLFDAGLQRLHLRKPGCKREVVEELIGQIEPAFRKYISIHYHEGLAMKYKLGGKHLSGKELQDCIQKEDFRISCSLHHWDELPEKANSIDYCFMSPVFDSISKSGYVANESLLLVPDWARPKKVYALGGIDSENFMQPLSNGFYGIAVLGHLWADTQKAISRFNYLKQGINDYVS
jgi:thiamine-phosphate pyrophosphorylase